jgi:hypothetical protein
MMKIYQGTDEEMERVARRAMIEALAIASGAWKKVIPLNGGSQTRRDSREYYHQLFHGSNIITVESNSWSITLRSSLHAMPNEFTPEAVP